MMNVVGVAEAEDVGNLITLIYLMSCGILPEDRECGATIQRRELQINSSNLKVKKGCC